MIVISGWNDLSFCCLDAGNGIASDQYALFFKDMVDDVADYPAGCKRRTFAGKGKRPDDIRTELLCRGEVHAAGF